MSQDVLFAVKEAITALSIPSETQRANIWLIDFEKQKIAWESAIYLLMEPSQSLFRFYGAKILYSKIQRDFYQLENSNSNNVTESNQNSFAFLNSILPHQDNPSMIALALTTLIVKNMNDMCNEKPLDMKVCRYLSLSLSALSLQLNQVGIIKQLLVWLNPSITVSPRIILQLLIVLPEECYNQQINVNHAQRDSFSQQLTESSVEVVNFLQYLWSSGDLDVKLQILHCLENWIRFTNIPAENILNQDLYFQSLMSVINDDIFLEASVDLATTIVHKYRVDNMALVNRIIEMLYGVIAKWTQKMSSLNGSDVDEDDLHSCQSMSRLFAEVAEEYIDLILSKDPTFHSFQNVIVQQLSECATFSFDINISRIPLKFFYELSSAIRSSHMKSSSDFSYYQSKFSSLFINLLGITINQLTMPIDILYGRKSISDDVSERRYEWKDTVVDCCQVIGSLQCLDYFHGLLNSEYQKVQGGFQNWNTIESIMFSLQMLSKEIPHDENHYLPPIFNMIMTFPPDIMELRLTILNLIGKLSPWISNFPVYFGPVINSLLVPSLRLPKSSVAAARSIMEILVASSGKISFSLTELFNLASDMRSTGSLTLSADLYLIEAASVTISNEQAENHLEYFWNLVQPLLASLQTYMEAKIAKLANITQVDASELKTSKAVLSSHLEKLTVAFRHVRIPGEIVLQVFIRIFPVIQVVLDINHSDFICEKLCRLLKHSIRSCGMALSPHLDSIISYVTTQFQKYFLSGFIYVGSIFVSDFSKYQNGQHVNVLYQMIWSISNTVIAKITSLEQLTDYPDVIEEYFYMLSKVMRFCPKLFMTSSNESGVILKFASNALSLPHREAQKGILSFFENFIQVPSSCREDEQLQRNQFVEVVCGYGDFITSNMFSLLSAQYTAYAIDERDGCICDVLWSFKMLYYNHFQGWLQNAVNRLSREAIEEANKLGLVNELLVVKDKSNFASVLDDYEYRCNRRRG